MYKRMAVSIYMIEKPMIVPVDNDATPSLSNVTLKNMKKAKDTAKLKANFFPSLDRTNSVKRSAERIKVTASIVLPDVEYVAGISDISPTESTQFTPVPSFR